MASPGAPTLLLVPTALERDGLGDLAELGALVHLAGFGPLAAALRAGQLIERYQPKRVVLVGIAGAYPAEVDALGRARTFDRVVLDGVGAGEGPTRLGVGDLGFTQWAEVADELPLEGSPGTLLTVCAASASSAQAAERAQRHGAVAEDMEAFGVALACATARLPLTVVRGFSNLAGDRDHASWQIDAALAAARDQCFTALRP